MSGNSVTLTCPVCQNKQESRGRAMTIAATCKACHVYFGAGPWMKDSIQFRHREEPAIPIGARGRIENFLYEVIGFVVKKETKYHTRWREYLLFNPYRGYAFLSEYDGHWNFVWPMEQNPKPGVEAGDFTYKDRTWKLFQKYSAEVIYAKGEFFFDVYNMTQATRNAEYISPPYLLALEKSDDSQLWCKGEYFTPKEIADIFKIPKGKLPSRAGVGSTQPLGGNFSRTTLAAVAAVMIAVTFIIQYLLSASSEEKVVYRGTFEKSALTDQKMLVTPSFDLTGGTKSLEFYIEAPLTNDWFYG